MSTAEQLDLIERVTDSLLEDQKHRLQSLQVAEGAVVVQPSKECDEKKPGDDGAAGDVEQKLLEQLEELVVQSHALRTENEAFIVENRDLREQLAQQAARAQLVEMQLAALKEEYETQKSSVAPLALPSATTNEQDGSHHGNGNAATTDAAVQEKGSEGGVGDGSSVGKDVLDLLDRSLCKSDIQRLHLWLDTHHQQAVKAAAPSLATFSIVIRDEKEGGPFLQLVPPKRRSTTPIQQRVGLSSGRLTPPAAVGTTPLTRTGVLAAHRSPGTSLHSVLSPAASKSLALHAWGTTVAPRSTTPPSSVTRPATTLPARATPLGTAPRRTGSPAITVSSPQTAKVAPVPAAAARTSSKSPSVSRPTASKSVMSPGERRGSSPGVSRAVKVSDPPAHDGSPAVPKLGVTKAIAPAPTRSIGKKPVSAATRTNAK